MKHKPDGILVNGSNPAGIAAQGVYDHKRKIDVSFTSLNVTFSVGKFRFLTALIFQLPVNSSELAVSNVKRPNLKRSKYGLSEAPYSNVGVKSPLNNGKNYLYLATYKVQFLGQNPNETFFVICKQCAVGNVYFLPDNAR